MNMSLAQGRTYLAIPGPSVVPDRVLNAMHRASPDIYAPALFEMVRTLYPDLQSVARTRGEVAIYIGNGHAMWEAALVNVLSRGDHVLALATGPFGIGWANVARGLGATVDLLDFGRRNAVDPQRVADVLKSDKSRNIKAVTVTHTDTATSVRNDVAAIRAALDASGHPALLMVDCIASLACDRFEMDEMGVDVAIAASQKGLMLPPGLGFVWFGEKAASANARADMVTPYWNWLPRVSGTEFYQKFDGTAPAQHLYGLRAALDMLVHEEGMPAVWQRHEKLAHAVWAALDCWGDGGPVAMNVAKNARRSHAVTTVGTGAQDAGKLRRWVEASTGVSLGIGLGMADAIDAGGDHHFRIAHMGHVNSHMVLGALGAIEAGLSALAIPHGTGGLAAAARMIGSA